VTSLVPETGFAQGASGPANVYDTSPAGLGLSPSYLAPGASASASSAGAAAVQHNDIGVGTEPILDFEDTALLSFAIVDDNSNTRVKVSMSIGGQGTIPFTNPVGTSILQNKLLAADAQPAFTIGGDGKLAWGPGGVTAPDTNLYRSAVGALKTDGTLAVTGDLVINSGTSQLLQGGGISLDYDGANYFLSTTGHNRLLFGGDSVANLYRGAAGQLKTDSLFIAEGQIYSQTASGAGGGFVYNPFASGGNTISSTVQGEANPRFYMAWNGALQWGPGSTATDTNFYRNAAGVLKTDGNLIITADYALRGLDATTQFKVVSGSTVGTTNGAGELAISFGVTFAFGPVVVVCNGDTAATAWGANPGVKVSTLTTTGVTVSTGVVSNSVRVDWIAYGQA